MPDIDSSAVSGVEVGGYRRGSLTTDRWDQYVIPVRDRIVSYQGRSATFRNPGRAAVGQKILALHNASGSSVLVNVNRIKVDLLTTALKAATVVPPIIRVHRFTALPTGGTALVKTPRDTALSSSASVTVWGDASADGTVSTTTLTITPGAIIAQAWAIRMVTAAGFEVSASTRFFDGEPDITLRALEGLVVFLDLATVTTGNPATDSWIATIDWDEYTRP